MLVANPGQAPYSIISTKTCSNKSTRNNATSSSASRYIPPSSATIESSTSTVVSKMMTAVTAIPTNNELNNIKTLSVRITREADLFKNTVQKALPSKIPSHHISALSLYTVPPTTIHRYPERIETHSADSLKSEMCHFKPIRTVPKTPAKRSKAATIKIPVAIKEARAKTQDKRPKQSISLTESINYTQPRISAFSFITVSSFNTNQQTKTDKSTQISRKVEQTANNCTVTTTGNNISSVNSNAYENLIPPTSVKHRTRYNAKTMLTSTQVVEEQNNKTKPQRDRRVTRKRQQTHLEKCETVPEKNAKLSKDCSKPLKTERRQNSITGRSQPNRRTPPVTRSRLKQSLIHTRKQYQHK